MNCSLNALITVLILSFLSSLPGNCQEPITHHVQAQSNKLEGFIKTYAAAHHFNGAILVQKNKKVIYEGAFGKANRQFNIPNQTNTKFRIASITKLFTSVLILQLYEQGKIDLRGAIKTYLPDYKGEGAEKVTVHHLLNHTSGIENMEKTPDSECPDWLDVYGKPFTTDQILLKFCSGKMENEPGKVFSYNNGDYVILGKIIERIYHQPFQEVLKAQILTPLNMASSGMFFQLKVVPEIADTYSLNQSSKILENDEPVYIENWYAAGSMYANTRDLLIFINSIFEYKILKKETLALLTTPGLDDYGYGVWIRGGTSKVMERYGRIRGTNTVILRYLDSDLTIIILGNTDMINNLGPFGYLISKKL